AVVQTMAALVPGSEQALSATLDRLEGLEDDPKARAAGMRRVWTDPRYTIRDIFSDPAYGPQDVAFLVNQVQERDAKAERATDRQEAAQDRAERRADRAARVTEEVLRHPLFSIEFSNVRSAKAFQPDGPGGQWLNGEPPADLGERLATAE